MQWKKAVIANHQGLLKKDIDDTGNSKCLYYRALQVYRLSCKQILFTCEGIYVFALKNTFTLSKEKEKYICVVFIDMQGKYSIIGM